MWGQNLKGSYHLVHHLTDLWGLPSPGANTLNNDGLKYSGLRGHNRYNRTCRPYLSITSSPR